MSIRTLLIPALAALALLAPAVAQAGPETVLTGTLRLEHSDDFADKVARYEYALFTSTGRFTVRFNNKPDVDKLPLGKRVSVRGSLRTAEKSIVVPDGGAVEQSSSGATAAAATGARKTAVILFNFSGDTRQPWTPDAVRSAVFTGAGSVNAYYKEQSFGQVSFTGKVRTDGDVYGWYTIPETNSGCQWSTWAQSARKAAASAGVDLTGYQHVVFMFPQVSSCAWAGLAYLPGTESWINGTLSMRVISHELGHNLSAHHASSLSCTDATGARVAISSTCTASEYGDPFDVMGGGSRHMSAYHKGGFGWLGTGNKLTVTASGTYTIAPLEQSSLGVQSLRIARGTSGKYVYLEFRQPFGFDSFPTTDPAVNGVSIRTAPDYGASVQPGLLDNVFSTTTFTDAPLGVGKTFFDADYAISVTTKSVSTTGATIEVMVGGAPPPADTTAPTAPSGLAGQGAPGPSITLSWTASTDNVGVAGYRVSRNGVTYANAVTASWTDTTVTPGVTYSYNVRAYDAAGNVSAASSDVSVTAPNSSADTTAPTAPSGLAGQGAPGPSITLSWTASTDNVGVAGYRVSRNGVTYANAVTASWTDTTVTPGVTYSYNVRAYDAAGNVSAASSDVSVTAPNSSADTTAPTAPSGLAGQGAPGPSITLSWTASTDNVGVAGYRVSRNGVTYANAVTASWTDTTVTPGVTYSYNVRAYDAAGNVSAASSDVSVTAPNSSADTTAPTAPSGLAGQGAPGPSITLSWTASTDNVGVAGYRVSRNGVTYANAVTASWTDTTVTPGVTYSYNVRAYDAAGNVSAASSDVSVTAPNSSADTTAPTAPSGLAGQGAPGPSITLSWTASTDNVGVAGYRVYRGGVQVGTTSTTSFTDTSVAPSTTYTYTVRAVDAAGNLSDASNTASATTPGGGADTTAPSQPSYLMFSGVYQTSVTFSWLASTDDVGVTGYDVLVNGSVVGTTTSTRTTISGLTCNTAYTFGVRAYDAAGNRSTQGSLSTRTAAC